MATATDLKDELYGLSTAEKSERLISAGFVRNGKANFVAFYEAILAEKSGRDPVSERTEMMSHFVNKWAPEYSARQLKLAWEIYSEQVNIDGNYDAIDEFISDYGMANIGFYDSFADMMEDYDRWAVMAFIGEFGITNIEQFPVAFQGTYRSEAEFAEEFCTQQNEIPFYIVADWQATWECNLRYDYVYDEDSGAVFAQNF